MKREVILLLLCITLSAATAQTAEDDVTQLVTYAARINYFNRLCPRERVYLHFDNTAYFQGETIYYAAYVTDDAGIPNPASRVLYVELLSPTGVIIKQHKLKIVGGRCHGAFQLVDTSVKEAIDRRGAAILPSGYYQIRAYTHSMLNFDDAAIFSRVIPVYQLPEREGHYENPVVGEYPYSEIFRPEPTEQREQNQTRLASAESRRRKSETQPSEKKSKKPTLSFYPEGGHLIAGVPCSIAFKAIDENGLGVDISELRTKDGKNIPISPQHRGMGKFEWLTQKGGEQIVANIEGTDYKCTLPTAEARGCALHVSHNVDSLVIHIDAVGMARDAFLAYTLTERGRLCAFDTLRVVDKTEAVLKQPIPLDIAIPTGSLPTGVCQFTLFNPSGDILSQRMLFIDNGMKTIPVTFTATKPEYRPFERIQMTFRTEGNPYRTFSLAVRDAADYGTAYADDIRTYMLLSSELKGLIEDPGWYFEELGMRNEELGIIPADGDDSAPSNPSPITSNPIPNSSFLIPNSSDRKAALDLLMMVQGWTRYDWQQMAGVTPFKVRHYTEQQLVLGGWAFSRITERPLQNTKVDITLISPDRNFKQEATVTTDADGYWSVGLGDYYGKWHLYYHTEQDKKTMKKATTRIRLERSYKPGLYAYTPIETYLPDHKASNALLPSWREDISDFVMPHDAIPLNEVEVKASVLYVDYGTFHAYDAAAACEDIFDEGDYTYDAGRYLYRIGFFNEKNFQWPEYFFTGATSPQTADSSYRYIPPVLSTRIHRYVCLMGLDGKPLNRDHRWMVREDDMEFINSVMVYDTIADPRVLPCFKQCMRDMSNRALLQLMGYIFRGDKFMIAEIIYGNPGFSDRRGKNERLTTFSGYTPVVGFYAPTYPDGPVPGDKDYRRTIYWNPEVTTDSTGHATVSFYNNGYSRALTVSAEGLTPDGVPIINQ